MKIEIGQVIAQIISFLILLWILKRYAWKPLLQMMEERRHLIKSEFDEIERGKQKLLREEEEYNKKIHDIDLYAHKKVQESVEKGKLVAGEIQQKALGEAREIIQKAKEDSHNEVLKAKAQLKDELVNMTLAATQQVLRAELDQEKQKKLIRDFIKETG